MNLKSAKKDRQRFYRSIKNILAGAASDSDSVTNQSFTLEIAYTRMQGQTQEAEQMHCGHISTPTCGSQTERKKGNIGEKGDWKAKDYRGGNLSLPSAKQTGVQKKRGEIDRVNVKKTS